jgi:hypothetical protein
MSSEIEAIFAAESCSIGLRSNRRSRCFFVDTEHYGAVKKSLPFVGVQIEELREIELRTEKTYSGNEQANWRK